MSKIAIFGDTSHDLTFEMGKELPVFEHFVAIYAKKGEKNV